MLGSKNRKRWLILSLSLLGAFMAGLLIHWVVFYGDWPQATPALRLVFSEDKEGLPYLIEQQQAVVVNITAQKKGRPLGKRRTLAGIRDAASQGYFGSGVILNPEGYILTNYHVIDKAKQIRVTLSDREEYQAQLVGIDPGTDLALIKIHPAKKLQAARLADSDQLRVGDTVLAIGNPWGMGQSVSKGIVSAKERSVGLNPYEELIQTDAAINPGCSGGGLFNLKGELVGVVSSTLTNSQGISFAIPSNVARQVAEILRSEGRLLRGWLGIRVQELNRPLIHALKIEDNEGVLVSSVESGGPGRQAGLRRGDVITTYEGQPIKGVRDFQDRVALTPEGKQVELSVVRQGDPKTLTVMVVHQEVLGLGGAIELEDNRFGLTLRNLYVERPGRAGESPRGLLVVALEEDGAAVQSGLKPGDILLEIDGQAIFRIEEYRKALDRAGHQPLLLFLQRGADQLYLALQ
ncbi:MAG: trypsin-like peptidase domain-containing protein [Candidatus Tectomicrobia bacterium]|uniref:Trypsin-like peptidase domain-containing protein n=1 Tax=Tectimicrobiota bacterium TaxID=2528274 RepID=A0A932CNE1_UNCTE|nr:trypsin-like peptidase domain-containing protein [Candidatus Tectomicrobia bacterium]